MKLFNRAKWYVKVKVNTVNHLVSEQKHKLDVKVLQLREELILKYMMPQFLQYVKETIISKGLNPDVMPAPKVVAVVDDRPTTRNKSTNFCFNEPHWLKESFKDESKHLINKIRTLKTEAPKVVVTIPVVETPEKLNLDGILDTSLESILSTNIENLLQLNREKIIEDKPAKRVRLRKKVVVAKENLIDEAPKKSCCKKIQV
jgi:hypothetical protein